MPLNFASAISTSLVFFIIFGVAINNSELWITFDIASGSVNVYAKDLSLRTVKLQCAN
jgi:hypothetical protein